MERKFKFSVEEYYHIYNRGNNKAPIFLDSRDRNRFIALLFVCNSEYPVVVKSIGRKIFQGRTLDDSLWEIDRGETIVDIGVYCLMPNHFHILIREKKEGGISSFVKKMSTGYSLYFNKRHNRTGALYEGKFRAEHVNDDKYLKYLYSYIHLNPVKLLEPEWKDVGIKNIDNIKKYLEQYVYSSYLDYIGVSRGESDILHKEAFPEYFQDYHDFEFFIEEWLNYKNSPLL